MKAALRFTAYYGMRRFLLLAPTFALAPTTPYRRLTPTLLVARERPFELVVEGAAPITAHAALIAPKVRRHSLRAIDSDLAIFDLPLRSLVPAAPVQTLDRAPFAPLTDALAEAARGRLPCGDVDRLFEIVLATLGGAPPPPLDPRVAAALQRIDELPFDEVTLPGLARHFALSPSRLRHVFVEATGYTVGHYARWAAVWRAIELWSRSPRTLTDVAHEVGFHDLSHLDHAFIEVFGVNPSTVTDRENVTLIRC